jgi:hypothetical protein
LKLPYQFGADTLIDICIPDNVGDRHPEFMRLRAQQIWSEEDAIQTDHKSCRRRKGSQLPEQPA